MRFLTLRIGIWLLLLLTASTGFAASIQKGGGTSEKYQELAAKQELDRQLMSRDLQYMEKRMDEVDSRISNQNEHVSHGLDLLGHMLTVLTIVLTVGGLAGYLTVRAKAAAEARAVGKEEVLKWFAENAGVAKESVDNLQRQLEQMQASAANLLETHREKMSNIAAATEILQADVDRRGASGATSMSPEASVALAQSAKVAQDKPASERSFDDWNSRAFDAYRNKDWKVALSSWEAASSFPAATDFQKCTALLNMAHVKSQSGDEIGAVNSYRQLISEYRRSREPGIIERVVTAMIAAGDLLAQIGRKEEAVATFEEAIAESKKTGAAWALRSSVAALFNLGCVLGDLGRWEAVVASYREAVALSVGVTDPDVARISAMSLVNLGTAERKCGRQELGLKAYEQVLAECPESNDPEIKEQVAKAGVAKGRLLVTLTRREEALLAFRDVVTFADREGEELKLYSIVGMRELSAELANQDKLQEAFDVYAGMFSRFKSGESKEIDRELAIAKFNNAVALHRVGRIDDELRCYLECDQIIEGDSLADLDHLLAIVLMNTGIVLGNLGSREAQIQAFDRLIDRFGDDARPDIKGSVARGELIRAFAYLDSNEEDLGTSGLASLVERYFNDSNDLIEQIVVQALLRLGDVYTKGNNYDEADSAYAKIIFRLQGRDGDIGGRSIADVVRSVKIGRGFVAICRGKSLWTQGEDGLKNVSSALQQF